MITIKEQNKIEDTIPLSTEEQNRLKKLQEKKQNSKFEIAFCGHFSAGKSTILNEFLGAEILPTSPIPTSANIIEISNGDMGLTVKTKNEQEKSWFGKIPWEQVRQWGMDGNEFSRITITVPLSYLSTHSCILDTPGVDSTDDSHEALTVEQLFTTDVVVYVMDYNHVQSEVNLYFLKQLSSQNKSIYVIINQIDKHDEGEIPFDNFKLSIQETFRRWDINYLDMYFTSMKEQDHKLNQFKLFEHDIKALLYNSNKLLNESLLQLEKGLYKTVEQRLLIEKQEFIDTIKTKVQTIGYHVEQLDEQHKLERELEQIRNFDQRIWDDFNDILGNLFKNVILFPSTTTDLVRKWLESIQPDFKIGLFFSKKKTLEEQEKRLNLLVSDLQDKIKSQLLFHVHSFYQQVARTKLSNIYEFENAISNLNFVVTSDFLTKHVKHGHTNRDYVFTFTAELTNMIVKEIKEKAREITSLQIEGMNRFLQIEEQILIEKLFKLKDLAKYVKQIDRIDKDYSTFIINIQDKISPYLSTKDFNKRLLETAELAYPNQILNIFTEISLPSESLIGEKVIEDDKTIDSDLIDLSETENSMWLESIMQILPKGKGKILEKDRNNLIDRIDRYRNQKYLISLFGAFSAGKSSFANALLGDNVLPISPNPTTATINIVEKSTDKYSHKTANVTLKTKETINQEIKLVSKQLELSLDIDQLMKWKPNLKAYLSSWQKTNIEYLLMLKQSLASLERKLGSEFTTDLQEAQKLVADESKACLIEKVNIYYDSPITEQGIVLVDTPGINSIHGRHTNVAFQQLRDSDAIFYLSYFNHTFTKSDQHFIQQIGKVNEGFQNDKLYFIINASDLAENEDELNGVKQYIHNQLFKNGLQSPKIYHLSSKEGLKAKKEKLAKETSFTNFERLFYERTILELKQLNLKMIKQQFNSYKEKLNDSITFMNQESSIQRQKQKQLNQTVLRQIKRAETLSFSNGYRDILRELDELTLYLRERMKLVLNDLYLTSINVSVLTGNSKKELQQQLSSAIKEWEAFGEHFLKQELVATVIRIDTKIKEQINKWVEIEVKEIQKELPYANSSDEFDYQPIDIKFSTEFTTDSSKYLSIIKSKKDFFENGKVKELKEQLVAEGAEIANLIITTNKENFIKRLDQVYGIFEKDMKEYLIKVIQSEQQRFEALFDDTEKELLVKELDELEKVIKMYNSVIS